MHQILKYHTYIEKTEFELAVVFIVRFNLTCQAFRLLAFSPLSAETFNVFILGLLYFAKRNETKRNGTKRNGTKRNEKSVLCETKWNETLF